MRIVVPWINFIILGAASSAKPNAQRGLIPIAQHKGTNDDTRNRKYRICCWSYAVYFMDRKSDTLG
jgi:hypothetical protein